MALAKWKDLPAELLLQISSSCGGPNELHKVCKDWKIGLETISPKLTIASSHLPRCLPDRFPVLKLLNLQSCKVLVTPKLIRELESLPLTHLALKIPALKITPMLTRDLHALGLTCLELELAGEARHFEDAHLWRLAGTFISSIVFSKCCEVCTLCMGYRRLLLS